MMTTTLTPRLNVWLEHDGRVVLSPWRVRLLEAIDQTGSISAAADRLTVPYRLAWERLAEMEDGLGLPLVERRVGGAGGGGAKLTPVGRRFMERFAHLSSTLESSLEQAFLAAFADA